MKFSSCIRQLFRFWVAPVVAFALWASPAGAETPGSATLFLSGENVRKELRISPSQARALDRLRTELRGEIQPFLEGRNAASASVISASIQAYDQKALAILTPTQRQNLRRIEARVLGPWLLHSPSVQTQLNLSEDQIRRINGIAERVERHNQRMHQRVERGRLTQPQRLESVRSYRLQQNPKLLGILTPEQLAAFQALSS
jgi:hypothetical protein